MTWPLAPGIARDVPGDLGDSLLNLWILGWGAENLPRVAHRADGPARLLERQHLPSRAAGAVVLGASVWRGDPDPPRLPPHRQSDSLLQPAVPRVLRPVGHGACICWSAISSDERDRFSGAAFVAGLIFAFVPFRIAQVAHIQSLSSQWMPLALYGFRRFIVTGRDDAGDRLRLRPLVGGSAALLMQNWSCGYYLIFFAPFVPSLRRAPDDHGGTRAATGGAGGHSRSPRSSSPPARGRSCRSISRRSACTASSARSREVIRFSADVWSYFTAPEALRLWGPVLQAYPKPEGELFFGVVPMLLTGWPLSWRSSRRRQRQLSAPAHARRYGASRRRCFSRAIVVAAARGASSTDARRCGRRRDVVRRHSAPRDECASG